MPKGKVKLTPEFEDLLHVFNRMKDADVRSVVEELERQRREAVAVGQQLIAERDASHSEWRLHLRETGQLTFRLFSDGLIFVVVWAVLWIAHAVQGWLPMEGQAPATLSRVHEYATIILYIVLVAAVIKDMVLDRILGKRHD